MTITVAALFLTMGCEPQRGVEIGSRGGVLVSEDGRLRLQIPKGALEQEVEITIDDVECDAPKVVGSCYELGPVGLPLLRPGIVRYELDEETLDGIDVEHLELLTEREGVWRSLADHEHDLEHEAVVASTVYLSTYAARVDEPRS